MACAEDVSEAVKFISLQPFDVLLSDLHMPGPVAVVGAMWQKNPEAVTLLLGAFLETSAANAILMQTDEILVKPMRIPELIQVITHRLVRGPLHKRKVERLSQS